MAESEEPPFQLFSSLQYCEELLTQEENTILYAGQPCPYYMLPYHRDRILQAARNFGWQAAISALQAPDCLEVIQSRCKAAIDNITKGLEDKDTHSIAVRLRVLISKTADFTAEVNVIPRVPPSHLFPTTLDPTAILTAEPNITIFDVHLDTQPTPPTDLTRYKTTSRDHYNNARTRVGITGFVDPKEVVLWSPEGLIMEGSITNVYFYREDRGGWITPTTPTDSNPTNGLGAGGTAGTVRRWLLEKGMVTVADVKRNEVEVGEWVWLSNGVKGMVLGRVESV
ncbi:hypothetical protein H072_1442 [Dactylellina haptotyla CBS 200.50]|uniref:Aminodeoxychorismate lyase n=1 Tax=Dactylellina haptotyla (strain CBS 200.50) TaxID=1284197 RepID=S8BYG5_DACHA|nr:hypothetical protein H072_1442 [Dactylellina haptotyla CBS 200.50]